MNLDFTNKLVLVTGATKGIGKQIADDFEHLNASVIRVGSKDVNFLDQTSTHKFADKISGLGIDICINNAGINRLDRIEEITATDYNDVLKVNLLAPFTISQAVSQLMIDSGGGKIINISSIWGTITKEKRLSYSTSKAGLIGLSKSLAIDLAKYNILVNTVSPGFTLTALTASTLSKDEMKQLIKQIPLKRFASVNEISKIVLFLASDLNTYITGQNIIVDGGFTSI